MPNQSDSAKWQASLKPMMIGTLAVLCLAFFVVSLIAVQQIQTYIGTSSEPRIDIGTQGSPNGGIKNSGGTSIEPLPQAMLTLEANVLEKRYRHASALLLSRIWTRYMAFVTGMILAFVGAAFVLGKLSEGTTTANLEAGQLLKGALATTSPGIVLATLGVLLIETSLLVQPPITLQDTATYVGKVGFSAAATPPEPPASTKIFIPSLVSKAASKDDGSKQGKCN